MKKFLIIVLRILSWIDYFYRRLARWVVPFGYRRVGKCKKCGECCTCILISMEPRFLKQAWARNFAIWWNDYFNDLTLIGCLLDEGILSFKCRRQNPDGTCGNYTWLRPVFCYEYPRIFKYFEKPVTLPGCGFRFTSSRK